MKKRMRGVVVLCALLMITAVSYGVASAQGAEPGSTADPIVTKSYVDQKLTEVMGLIANIQTAPPSTSGNTGSSANAGNQGSTEVAYDESQLLLLIDFLLTEKLQESSVASGSFEAVLVPAGKTIMAAADGLELILRSGKGVVYAGENGLSDVTSGQDIGNGKAVSANHLLICGRSGRGVKTSTEAWFMAKGSYVIMD